jgi:lambda family phage portal protein
MADDPIPQPDNGHLITTRPYAFSAMLHKNLEAFPGQLLVTPPRLSARQEGKMSRKDAVRMARHAERTSEHIRGSIDRKADMVVGASLRVIPQPDFEILGIDWKYKKDFAQACHREFANWGYDSRCLCDAEGHYDFGGMMWMAFRNITGPDAECAGVIHYDEERAVRYNHRWATFVTIVDPDRIETPPELAGDEAAGIVFEGKRLDPHRRMIGLYISTNHPSEGLATDGPAWTYVPRETWWGRPMAFHWFFKTRGGQQRGVTRLATILKRSHMLDELDTATVATAVLQTVISTYIKSMSHPSTVGDNLNVAPARSVDWEANRLNYYDQNPVRVGGARVVVLPKDDELVMDAINRAAQDPTAFRNGFLREFASAIGVSFEQLSNNYSDANYSAARAALLDVWRGVIVQRTMFTAHVASLIYSAVIEEAIFKGRIQLPPGAPPFKENRAAYARCGWIGPGMGWIDPLKEAQAQEVRLRSKTTTRQKEYAAEGEDYLEGFDQIEQEHIEAEERGFTLDPPLPGQAGAADASLDPDDDGNPADKPPAGKPKPKPAGGQ